MEIAPGLLAQVILSFHGHCADYRKIDLSIANRLQKPDNRIMPETSNALVSANAWVATLLTGTLGTVIAILAVTGTGFAILQGRLAVRNGIRVVLGCFILFGAPSIARGLSDLAVPAKPAPAETYSSPPPPVITPTAPQPNRDPYAGASVPM